MQVAEPLAVRPPPRIPPRIEGASLGRTEKTEDRFVPVLGDIPGDGRTREPNEGGMKLRCGEFEGKPDCKVEAPLATRAKDKVGDVGRVNPGRGLADEMTPAASRAARLVIRTSAGGTAKLVYRSSESSSC